VLGDPIPWRVGRQGTASAAADSALTSTEG